MTAKNEEHGPFWSVMIPVYNPPEKYLEETLRSVLAQDPGPERMQIEVVDDCSPNGPPSECVRRVAGDRVKVHCEPKNNGLARTWNLCIERARGKWVHLLHQDDSVLPGFYQRLEQAAEEHPEVSLLATRSFVINEKGVITGVSKRLPTLEKGGRDVRPFFLETPIFCPGIAIRKNFYETHGRFRLDLSFVLDREMWARAVGAGGGLVTPEVLSCYRVGEGSETSRLNRTADSVRDIERCNKLFAERYPQFDRRKGRDRACWIAMEQYKQFAGAGDHEAAKANLDFWKATMSWKRRLRQRFRRIISAVLDEHD